LTDIRIRGNLSAFARRFYDGRKTRIIRVMNWKPMTTNINKIRKHGDSFSGKYPEAVPTLKRGN
jgi:hypothetical protein